MRKFFGWLIMAVSAFVLAVLIVFAYNVWLAKPQQKSELGDILTDIVAPISAVSNTRGAREPILARGRAIIGLPKGVIVVHAPELMTVGEKQTIEANVGVNVPIETLQKHLGSATQTSERPVRVSPEMAATLNGAGFKIDAVTSEKQTIAEGFPTVWSWNIEAQQEDADHLEVTLYAMVGGDRQRVDSEVVFIVVQPTWVGRLNALGHEIDAFKAILTPMFGAATAAFGWFGFSLTRPKAKVAAKSGQRRKSAA